MEKKRFFKYVFYLAIFVLLLSCSSDKQKSEELKKQIFEVEVQFCEFVKQKGVAEGFAHFADDSATILRGRDSIIKGKEAIFHYYSNPQYQDARVEWKPEYVDVSKSGDLAYTFGHFTWKLPKPGNDTLVFRGIFHTVWKRQPDGSWKYVWD